MNNDLQVEWVNPDALCKNSWNSNVVDPENEAKIEASMDRFGMFKPILVRESNGSLEILGGEHRVIVAIRKGISTVPIINLGAIDDERAKEISLVDNGRYGSDDALLLNELLQSLDDQENLSKFLPYSTDEIDSLFASSSIDVDDLTFDDDDESPDLSEPAPTPTIKSHQIMRFKVPVEDSDAVAECIDRIIKEQGFTESDSLTNAGDALVYLIKGGNNDGR